MGKLNASEARLDMKLTCSDGQGKGLHLTPEAKDHLEKFEKLEHAVEAFLDCYSSIFSLSKTKIKSVAEDNNYKDITMLKSSAPHLLFLTERACFLLFIDTFFQVL